MCTCNSLLLLNQAKSTDKTLPKHDDQHELKPSKPNTSAPPPLPPPPQPPSPPTTKTNGTDGNKAPIQFHQLTRLPDGLSKYIVGDLIGTPLDEIDQFYKDQQVLFLLIVFRQVKRSKIGRKKCP